MDRVYVGELDISPAMATKIQTKHGVTPDEVHEVCPVGIVTGRWHVHPEYGRRFLRRGATHRGRWLKVILQPVDEAEGIWRLRTALAATDGRAAP